MALLRQWLYSRLAGYEDTNDAERLAVDPVMRMVLGQEARGNPAASSKALSRFETDRLTQRGNLGALAPGSHRNRRPSFESSADFLPIAALLLPCLSHVNTQTRFSSQQLEQLQMVATSSEADLHP